MEKRSIKMGVEKKRFLSQIESEVKAPTVPKDFPGKVIPAGNGANVIVTSLDRKSACRERVYGSV